MPTPDERSTADRIREQRKRARLSQRELSARIPYSYSLLNQVECGARVATADFTAAVAAALGIDITTLTGPPHVTEMQHGLLASLVRPIRESLALYDLAPDGNMPARPTDKLVHEADRLCQEVRATHLRKAARALPGVINDLTLAAHTVPTTEAWRALASTYRTAHDIAIKLGFPDLAIVALDRMGWAAEHASDPCLAAIRQYRRALGHAEAEQCLGRRLVAAGFKSSLRIRPRGKGSPSLANCTLAHQPWPPEPGTQTQSNSTSPPPASWPTAWVVRPAKSTGSASAR